MKIKVNAPAKVNLAVDVMGRRPDGYHSVSLVLQAISIYDTVTITSNESEEITISCNDKNVPCDKRNIAYKAAERFFHSTGIKNTGVNIDIEKVIPSQAGLGGGSSDGAAVIMGLNAMFNTHLKDKEMEEICSYIGADVPFFINGGTQLATGIGTDMEKLHSMPECYMVVCKPDINVSTKEAYDAIDAQSIKQFKYSDEVVKGLFMRSLNSVVTSMYNDFDVFLDIKEVNDIKKFMYDHKAKGACMSGSGSAVFGVFKTEKQAVLCANALKENYEKTFVCKPIKIGCSVI
ncbi:MAG: 4-(cytidine 5'-diphospho)-2-C-methyl-D-erythritol kinase [Ruminococcus sp.]